MSNEKKTFIIEATMRERWVPHFLSMLATMESYGSMGCSREVGIYCGGVGGFRPKFKHDIEFERQESVRNDNDNILFDGSDTADKIKQAIIIMKQISKETKIDMSDEINRLKDERRRLLKKKYWQTYSDKHNLKVEVKHKNSLVYSEFGKPGSELTESEKRKYDSIRARNYRERKLNRS